MGRASSLFFSSVVGAGAVVGCGGSGRDCFVDVVDYRSCAGEMPAAALSLAAQETGRSATVGGRWWLNADNYGCVPTDDGDFCEPRAPLLRDDGVDSVVFNEDGVPVAATFEWLRDGKGVVRALHVPVPDGAVVGDTFTLVAQGAVCGFRHDEDCDARVVLSVVADDSVYRPVVIEDVVIVPFDPTFDPATNAEQTCRSSCFEEGHVRPVGAAVSLRWSGGPAFVDVAFAPVTPGPALSLVLPQAEGAIARFPALPSSVEQAPVEAPRWFAIVRDPMTLAVVASLDIAIEDLPLLPLLPEHADLPSCGEQPARCVGGD